MLVRWGWLSGDWRRVVVPVLGDQNEGIRRRAEKCSDLATGFSGLTTNGDRHNILDTCGDYDIRKLKRSAPATAESASGEASTSEATASAKARSARTGSGRGGEDLVHI